ncbi:hypothetical protein KKG22_04730 [Patescibacteria group bacterium]|nr:hypothetical protein [Patescibacteria group bacterium]MBU1721641.1 hypothetical protein [Patescibacteria group bacterium]MBU1901648.1 hypothetical protein [Patescibacteria group bacterium]
MKKSYLGLLVLILCITFVTTGCKSKEEKAFEQMEKQAEKQMEQMSDVQEKLMNGEISDEEAEKMMNDMQADSAEATGHDAKKMPSWAKKVGFDDVKGMELVLGEEYTEKRDGFNSINLKYKGDYEQAMKEAERIAKGANVPKSTLMDASMEALEGMKQYMPAEALAELEEANKGAMYTNFDLMNGGETTDGNPYQMVITVEADGTLDITVVDYKKVLEVTQKNGGAEYNNFKY